MALIAMPFSYARSGVATYSKTTEVFEVMDHVSKWHPSLSKAYFNEWSKRFGLSLEDKSYLGKYADLRRKFHEEIKEGRDIFGRMPVGYDTFSKNFYDSKSIDEALKKLQKKKVKAEDVKFLKKFYSHFKKKINAFVRESTQFHIKTLDLNKKWRDSKMASYMKKFVKFFLGKQGRKVKLAMHPVWYTKGLPPRVDLRGPNLILRYYPLDTSNAWDISAYQEGAIMAILHGQSVNQRLNLTKIFQEKCRGREPEFQMAIKVVFADMLPKAFKEKKKFDLYKRWHDRNFVDVYAKLLYPLAFREIKGKGSFSGKFMKEAAQMCRQVHDLALIP
jgi:hypothetical protein